jgi:dipeptidase E
VRVVALWEGTMLRVEGDRLTLIGEKPARLFLKGEETRDTSPGESLNFLLSEVDGVATA